MWTLCSRRDSSSQYSLGFTGRPAAPLIGRLQVALNRETIKSAFRFRFRFIGLTVRSFVTACRSVSSNVIENQLVMLTSLLANRRKTNNHVLPNPCWCAYFIGKDILDHALTGLFRGVFSNNLLHHLSVQHKTCLFVTCYKQTLNCKQQN